MKPRQIWGVIKNALAGFVDDGAMTLAAALALYTALSLAPLLLIAIWVASLVWGHGAQEEAANRATAVVGPEGAQIIKTVLDNASKPAASKTAALVGFGAFVVSASGVFAQLQYSLNRIWNVQAKAGLGVWDHIRKRLWTLVMVLVIGAMFLASLIAGAVLSTLQHQFSNLLGFPWLWSVANQMVPLVIFSLLFATIYKTLPDVTIQWRDVWFGAIVTAILFTLGRYLIGLYIGKGGVTSIYGAAGSLVALLMWLYYSAIIFFLGAELTQAYARARGSDIRPDKYAAPIPPSNSPSCEDSQSHE